MLAVNVDPVHVQHRRRECLLVGLPSPGLEDPDFRKAAVKLAAALHGLAPRDLDGEDLRQHKRTIRTFGAFVAALLGLLVATLIFFAEARRERNEADQRARVAKSRAVAMQAMEMGDKTPDLSLLLSVASYRTADTLESRKALLSSLLAAPHVRRFIDLDGETTSALSFHPTRPILVSAIGNALLVRDLTSDVVVDLAQSGERFDAIHFFDGGAQLAAARSDGSLVLWNFDSRERVAAIAPAGSPPAEAPASGTIFPVVTGAGVRLWDLRARAVRAEIPNDPDARISNVAVDPSGRLVAIVTRGSGVGLWDVVEGRFRPTRFPGHAGWVESVAFSPDGTLLASTSQDETVIESKVADGAQKSRWPRTGFGFSIQYSDDGRSLAWITRSGMVKVLDRQEQKTWSSDGGLKDGRLLAFALGPDRLLAVADVAQMTILDLGRENPVANVHSVPGGPILAIAFSPVGALAATATLSGSLALWDTSTETKLGETTVAEKVAPCMRFSPDGGTLVTCSRNGQVLVWKIEKGRTVEQGWMAVAADRPIAAIDFNRDGSGIIAGDEKGGLWWWETGRLMGLPSKQVASLNCRISRLKVDPAGSQIAVGCDDGRILVLASDGRQLAELKFDTNNVSAIDFSRDGRRLFSAGPRGVVTWDVGGKTRIGTPFNLHAAGASGLAISPTGSLVVSSSEQGSLGLWDMDAQKLLGQVSNNQRSYDSVSFSPDGARIAAGASDGVPGDARLIFLGVDPESWVRKACAMAGRNLTSEEGQRYLDDGKPESVCGARH